MNPGGPPDSPHQTTRALEGELLGTPGQWPCHGQGSRGRPTSPSGDTAAAVDSRTAPEGFRGRFRRLGALVARSGGAAGPPKPRSSRPSGRPLARRWRPAISRLGMIDIPLAGPLLSSFMSVIAQAIADRQSEIDRLQAEIKALTDVEQILGA